MPPRFMGSGSNESCSYPRPRDRLWVTNISAWTPAEVSACTSLSAWPPKMGAGALESLGSRPPESPSSKAGVPIWEPAMAPTMTAPVESWCQRMVLAWQATARGARRRMRSFMGSGSSSPWGPARAARCPRASGGSTAPRELAPGRSWGGWQEIAMSSSPPFFFAGSMSPRPNDSFLSALQWPGRPAPPLGPGGFRAPIRRRPRPSRGIFPVALRSLPRPPHRAEAAGRSDPRPPKHEPTALPPRGLAQRGLRGMRRRSGRRGRARGLQPLHRQHPCPERPALLGQPGRHPEHPGR